MTPSILIAWREAHNMTQQQAADYFGKSLRTWTDYERGYAVPAMNVLAVVMRKEPGTAVPAKITKT